MSLSCVNRVDVDGNPIGGSVHGVGLTVEWQNGALVVDGVRREKSGAFIEDLLRAVVNRLEFYQSGKFACRDNAVALTHIETALLWLGKRTADREARGVEGTHTV